MDHDELPYEEFEEAYEDEVPTDHAESQEELMDFGEIYPPNVELLTQALLPDDGKPLILRARPWCCTRCRHVYQGQRNLICDTQQYKCYACNIENPTSQRFTLTRVKLNGVSLDFSRVYHQKKTDYCILWSFLALCDMTRRIRGAKLGCDESMPFDHVALLDMYQASAGFELGNPSRPLKRSRPGQREDIEIILKVATRQGVPYSELTLYDRKHGLPTKPMEDFHVHLRTLKVKGWFRINKDQIDYILRVLGHGYPLMAGVPAGKCFSILPDGQVYHAPRPNDCVMHSVVLHGWANEMPECDIAGDVGDAVPQVPHPPMQFVPCEVYYRCRNSYGSDAHPSFEKGGEGADFNVWAADVVGDIYGIEISDSD